MRQELGTVNYAVKYRINFFLFFVPFAAPTDGAQAQPSEDNEYLSVIIKTLNDTFGIDLSEEDKVDLQRMRRKGLKYTSKLSSRVDPRNRSRCHSPSVGWTRKRWIFSIEGMN